LLQYQASLTVDGVLLAKLLSDKPELLAHLDMENYTNLFLLSILINSCDGKADNIIAKYNEKVFTGMISKQHFYFY
jgi:hypothetical protein